MLNTRKQRRIYRHERIREKILGTAERPRLVVSRSLMHMSASVVNDVTGKMLFSLSTMDKNLRTKIKAGGNVKAAGILGEAFAVKAQEKGVKKVCFDRAGNLFHGRIKAFAEAARKGGLEF